MSTFSDDSVYLVLEDFGKFGQAYRETDPKQARPEDDDVESALRPI
jgi:hypothetical protein